MVMVYGEYAVTIFYVIGNSSQSELSYNIKKHYVRTMRSSQRG